MIKANYTYHASQDATLYSTRINDINKHFEAEAETWAEDTFAEYQVPDADCPIDTAQILYADVAVDTFIDANDEFAVVCDHNVYYIIGPRPITVDDVAAHIPDNITNQVHSRMYQETDTCFTEITYADYTTAYHPTDCHHCPVTHNL